jgi:hypothetical protein
MLAVRQRNSHKIHIKDQIVKYDRSQRVLRWVRGALPHDVMVKHTGNFFLVRINKYKMLSFELMHVKWLFRFSLRRIWRLLSSGLLLRVVRRSSWS